MSHFTERLGPINVLFFVKHVLTLFILYKLFNRVAHSRSAAWCINFAVGA